MRRGCLTDRGLPTEVLMRPPRGPIQPHGPSDLERLKKVQEVESAGECCEFGCQNSI